MRQVLAIFRKDLRRASPLLAAALALTALIGYLDDPGSLVDFVPNLLYILWVACWIFLGASLIHQEPLPGDRQYWITRPYDWRQLLAAKLLFAGAFAALPLIAMKGVLLWANGISPLRYAPSILSHSLIFLGAVGLVAGSLAAVTASLTQFLGGLLALAGLETAALILDSNQGGDGGALAWIRSPNVALSLAAVGMAVLLLQYSSRRTHLARALLAFTALFTAAAPFANAWRASRAVEGSRDSAGSPQARALALSFDPSSPRRMRYAEARLFPAYGREGLYLPIQVSGIPADAGVLTERVAVTIHAPDGSRWSSGRRSAGSIVGADPLADVRFLRADGPAWAYIEVDRAFYESVKNMPVSIHVSVALTVLRSAGNGTVTGFGQTGGLPFDGICQARPILTLSNGVRGARGFGNVEVSCAWPQPGPDRAYVKVHSSLAADDSSALLAAGAAAFLSVDQSPWSRQSAAVPVRDARPRFTIETWRASGNLERCLEITARPKDFAAPRVTDPE